MKRKRHSKKKIHVPANLKIDGLTITRMQKPYIVVACRCGVHGDTRYNRRQEKRDFKRQLEHDW